MNGWLARWRMWLVMRLAKKAHARHAAGIIAITGEDGRNTTEGAIYAVLSGLRTVRMTDTTLPPEIGIPLAFIGGIGMGEGFPFWLSVLKEGFRSGFMKGEYPELLILGCPPKKTATETLLSLARPQITLVTAISDAGAMKAAPLIEALPSNGYGILNADSPGSRLLGRHTRAHAMTFGFAENADMRIAEFGMTDRGTSCTLEYAGVRARIMTDDPNFSRTEAYAAAAAACVGIAFGMRLPRIAHALAYWRRK